MSTKPPPPKKPPVSENEKLKAADTVAAALGNSNGVSEKTGEVSAAEVKARATKAESERVSVSTPASKPAPPGKKPVPPGKKTEEASLQPTSSEPEQPDTNVAEAIGALAVAFGEHSGDVVAQLKKFQTSADKQFKDFREALAALMETSKATYDEVKAVQVGSAPRVEVRTINHGHVRVLFSCLPDDAEWLDDWAEENGKKYDVPPTELARLAKEFGFTVDHGEADGGVSVCINYDEQTGA